MGNKSFTQVPSPNFDSKTIFPFIFSIIILQMNSPRPFPNWPQSKLIDNLSKSLNIWTWSLSEIPIPESMTSNCTCSSTQVTHILMNPLWVNLIEFETRLHINCFVRESSISKERASIDFSIRISSLIPLIVHWLVKSSSILFMNECTFCFEVFSTNWLFSILPRSIKSFIKYMRRLVEVFTFLLHFNTLKALSLASATFSIELMISKACF